jgi:hypothetical protein
MGRATRPDSFRAFQHRLLVCCVMAYAIGLAAQTQTAVLEGTVQDVSGGAIANAAVTVRDSETSQTRTARTDARGVFRFSGVPVGTYEIRVAYDGFEPYAHAGVTLAIGQTARLNVALRPAGVTESVAVNSQPPPLDPRQTSVTTTIGSERIEELPVRSRNYLEFVLLAPAVTRPARQTTPGVVTSTLPASGFSFGGRRPRSNTLTIDGLDNNDEFTGSTRTELSLEFVREFQVVTNGWSVENGGASGGGINVVTKSGGNTLHGDAFLFGQFGALNAPPKLEETLGDMPSLGRYRGGLAVGGPLVKDRTFYYAAAEREHAHGQTASDIDSDIASAVNRTLSAGPFPQVRTRQLTIGLFPTSRAEAEWSAKATHQFDGRGVLVGRAAATHHREESDAFDASAFPSSFGITNRQVSPRAGVAWMPAPEWVIRGGAGFFADRLVLAALERGWLAQQRHVAEYITDQRAAIAPSVYTVRRGAWSPSSRQTSVGAERQLTSNLTASINYLFVRGHDLPRTVNVNLPRPTVLTIANAASLGVDAPVPQQLGRPVFGRTRVNPSRDGAFELQPTASSTYHGVTLALNRCLAREIEWSAAYTWSHARDSASEFDEQPQNPYALDEEWADSLYDQRQQVVVSALFDLPIGEEEDRAAGDMPNWRSRAVSHIEVAPILTIGSGHPVNVITGGDDNQSGAFPFTSRPVNVGRNSSRLPASATLDLRILKYFNVKPHGKLDLVIEAFNVLNRTNVTQVNPVYGPLPGPLRSLGRAIEAASARQLQFSIDFEF